MGKARTKNQRKRGRPRMEGLREENGRLSRSGIAPVPADIVALDARRRIYGLTAEEAKDQRAETFIGRLNMAGRENGLSDEQYDAAKRFRELHNTMLQTIGSSGAYYERTGAASSEESDEKVKWVRQTRERFSGASYAVFEAQQTDRTVDLNSALSLCVLQDFTDYSRLGALRTACNALARHFRLDSAKR